MSYRRGKVKNRTLKHKRILKLIELGYEIKDYIIKIKSDLTEDEAYSLEYAIIQVVGRAIINKGPLLNLVRGGSGALLGRTAKLTKEDDIQVKLMYEAGGTTCSIAREFNVSSTTISSSLRNTNTPIRSRLCNTLAKSQVTELCEHYLAGASTTSLGLRYGIPRRTVLKIITFNGIKIKSNRIPEEIKQSIAGMYSDGHSSTQLASMFNISIRSVLDIALQYGYSVRPNGRPRH